MTEQIVYVEAPTVEQAIEQGLTGLNKNRDEVQIKIIREEQPGLFQQTAENARIRISYNGSKLKLKIKNEIAGLMQILDIQDYQLEIELLADHYKITIESREQPKKLLGPGGATIRRIQRIVQEKINQFSEKPLRVVLDSGNYRIERTNQLIRETHYYANLVIRNKQSYRLESMMPEDRQIVHDTVATIAGLSSSDIGEGFCQQVELQPDKTR